MKKITAVAVLGTVLATAGCAKATEPYRDAPTSSTRNSSPATVIEMPDGFNNVATKCDNGHRLYVTFHGDSAYGSIAVVSDEKCATQP